MASKKVRENNTPVDIGKEVYSAIKVMSEEGNIKSIRSKVNGIMKLYLARNELHKTYFQHLDMIGVRENAIFIHDKKQDKALADYGKRETSRYFIDWRPGENSIRGYCIPESIFDAVYGEWIEIFSVIKLQRIFRDGTI